MIDIDKPVWHPIQNRDDASNEILLIADKIDGCFIEINDHLHTLRELFKKFTPEMINKLPNNILENIDIDTIINMKDFIKNVNTCAVTIYGEEIDTEKTPDITRHQLNPINPHKP